MKAPITLKGQTPFRKHAGKYYCMVCRTSRDPEPYEDKIPQDQVIASICDECLGVKHERN